MDPKIGKVAEFVMNDKCAAGIHIATARRVRNLLNRIGLEPDLVFSGGVSNNVGMQKALENLGHPISQVKVGHHICRGSGGGCICP